MSIMNIMNDPPPKLPSPSPSNDKSSFNLATSSASELPATFSTSYSFDGNGAVAEQIPIAAPQSTSNLLNSSTAPSLLHPQAAISATSSPASAVSAVENGSAASLHNGSTQLPPPTTAPSPQPPVPQTKSGRASRAGKALPASATSSSSKASKPKASKASGSGAMNPPSKRKRPEIQEDDGWTSDLEDPGNQAIYSTEIELYKQSLANRYSILEEEFEAQMKLKEKFVQHRAETAYTKRFDAVIKRVEWQGKREEKRRVEGSSRDSKKMKKETEQERRERMMGDGYGLQDEDGDMDSSMREPLPFNSRAISPQMIEFEPLPPPDPRTGLIPISETRAAQLEQAQMQIWSSIACREIPAVYRLTQYSSANKAQYWRRISTVAAREAKRGLNKSNKSNKDILLKTRKTMREMLMFWKKNEKEERDLRKKAEKDKLDKAKKEEDLREAKRQARKLNFLITQTELYSHFVGNKLKTKEAEESEDTASDAKIIDAASKDPTEPSTIAPVDSKPVDPSAGQNGTLAELDFDNDDEANLQAHARKNAEDAVNAAKQKAAAFDAAASEERKRNEANARALAIQRGEALPEETDNGEGSSTGLGTGTVKESDLGKVFDSDDMNFQNPTSMGMMDLRQPKMLTCSLKEYQLKGLNWLANLYEQGINGILADEMGLGKTVQSISLMAYLAEVHDIWGPFLVIAPASTLHNWQQEITRFVPQLKALPYWGNVKDRTVLRKFWNKKQISYNKDAPFHILVTSYQMVS